MGKILIQGAVYRPLFYWHARQEVSSQFSISDVALAKICKRMDITRPIRVTDRDRNPIVGSLNSFVANLITFAETKKPNGSKMK
jgi:hypothetical protein